MRVGTLNNCCASLHATKLVSSLCVTAIIMSQSSIPASTSTEGRSEEHTSELQSQSNLVCRLLLEKKKNVKCLRYVCIRMFLVLLHFSTVDNSFASILIASLFMSHLVSDAALLSCVDLPACLAALR